NYSIVFGLVFLAVLAMVALGIMADHFFRNGKTLESVFSKNKRYVLMLASTLFFGGGVSSLLFWATQNIAQENVVERFKYEAADFLGTFDRTLDDSVVMLNRVQAFFQASSDVTDDEFDIFVRPDFEDNASFENIAFYTLKGPNL